MFAIRFVFRLFVFVAGLAAIGIMFWSGITFLRNNAEDSTIVVAEELPSVGREPEDAEDIVLSLFLQSRADEINTPLSSDPAPLAFAIESGESALSVAQRLQELNMITDAELSRRYLNYNGLDITLEAGNYQLQRNMNMIEIGDALQRAIVEEIEVTIPEGWRAEQIAEHLTAEGVMDGQAFLNIVRQGTAVEHNILFDRPGGSTYEGYLFPDTYRLQIPAQPEDLLVRMFDNLASKLPSNTLDLATQQGLSFYQVLIVSSIVEREAVLSDERPIIASVYLNRLAPGSAEPYLNADPTVQYAMGYQPDTAQWWKTPVTLEEYQTVDSPYNTYITPGMPPGPIANPGINAIVAVLEPAQTNFMYFVCLQPGCEDGAHVFAETFTEHQQNVAIYQGQ